MMLYTFRKGPGQTVIIQEHEFDNRPMNEESLRTAIQNTRLQRESFANEGVYLNALVMYESALKFLLEEQA